MKLTNKYQAGELNYLAPEKEESFIKALTATILLIVVMGMIFLLAII